MSEFVVVMRGIGKSFSGVRVLEDVTFSLGRGQIHALLGENGAGKTTLVRILAGELSPDAGSIDLNGRLVRFTGPKQAQQAGIGLVHQELSLIPTLSVAENLYLGRLPRKNGLVDWKRLANDSHNLLDLLGVDFNPHALVSSLTVAKRQIVEIAKALALKADILIMDEPTASLSSEETDRLFRLMRNLIKTDKSVIYISHRLHEVVQIADQVTVMRDGRIVAEVAARSATTAELAELIVGRSIADTVVSKPPRPNAPIALDVIGIVAPRVKNVSLQVHQGEIVALYGLVGSGRTELARAICGIDRREAGEVMLFQQTLESNDPTKAIRKGIGYMPEDRKNQALFQILNVNVNMTITKLSKILRWGLLSTKLEKTTVSSYIKRMRVKAQFHSEIKTLSGGTQQKVGLAKWLHADSKVLVLDEPTKGIDVSARFDLYGTLRELASSGVGILLITSDSNEVLRVADRAIIMRAGKIVAELDPKETSEEKLAANALD